MNNIHKRLLVIVLVLLAGSAYVMFTKPTKLGLDVQGGMRVVLEADTAKAKGGWDDHRLTIVTDIIQRRVNALGVAESVVYPKPPAQVVVELPGLKNPEQARATISSTARLEFRYVPELDPGGEWSTRPEKRKGAIGDEDTGFETIVDREGHPVAPEELQVRVFEKDPILTGEQLKANSVPDVSNGQAIIRFEFHDEAKSTFEDFTRGHVGKTLAIFLDNKLISAPKIEGVIPGEGIIEGRFTPEAARNMSDLLNAGALPVPLHEVQSDTVQATLGRQAVHQTEVAGVVGLVLILIFMVAYYKVPGLLADVALLMYTLFSFAIFKLIPVTLTVPGIAGFILSIGMAVDANILIFERMKEERGAGKTMRAAIESGFKRAFTAIFDSNMCTLITCFILFYWGTGQVRGFAMTLAIGVAVSMFTAITVSRTFLLLLASTEAGQNDRLYSLGKGLHPTLNVSRNMRFWFGLSGLIIVPGIVFFAMGGLKPSIEFSSGTEISAWFTRQPTVKQVSDILTRLGHKEARIVVGRNSAYVGTRSLPVAEQGQVREALRAGIGDFAKTPAGTDNVNVSTVSPTVSKELVLNAFLQVVAASIAIVLYLAVRFAIPSFMEGMKYGTCAVIALIHDVFVVIGSFAIFGHFLHWQVDSLFVTAVLTVIGFSVHDTIVIFDRIRENLRHKERGEGFAPVADRSIEQTFARSVNTTLTVVITLLALLILGGPTVRLFVTALLIGVISGAYSSIFNATPLLVLWKRLTGDRDLAMAGAAGPALRPASPRPAPAQPRQRPQPQPRTTTPAAKPSAQPGPAATAQSDEGEDEGATAVGGGQRLRPKRRRRRQ